MRERWIDINGVRLFAAEDGAGDTVVTLHGPMADYRAALPLVASLSSRCRVVTPDLRGSGRSWCGAPLSFDLLADDLVAWLDALDLDQAVIGGVSGGSGVALRFALRYPARTRALVLVQPVYSGSELGLSADQQMVFAMMGAAGSRALDEGVQVLRPLFAHLPDGVREMALSMIAEYDAASVVATSRFLESGEQPFGSVAELRVLTMPTLVVSGNDPVHPPAVSDLYAGHIPGCTVVDSTRDVAAAIGAFLDARAVSAGR